MQSAWSAPLSIDGHDEANAILRPPRSAASLLASHKLERDNMSENRNAAQVPPLPCPCCEAQPAWMVLNNCWLCPNCGLQSIASHKETATAAWNRRYVPPAHPSACTCPNAWDRECPVHGERAEAIAAWNPRPKQEGEAAEVALDRYRYAVEWSAADSWDGCPECRARLEWARSLDDKRLSVNEVAAIGKSFLQTFGMKQEGLDAGLPEAAKQRSTP